MKISMNIPAAVIVSLVLVPGILSAGDTSDQSTKGTKGQFSSSDFKFVCEAARGGKMEVQAGELARNQASDPQVKEFGERMVTDHTKAGAELKTLASQKGASVPEELSSKEQRHLEHLQKLSGKDFDRAYMDAMVQDHEKDLKEFQKASKDSDDAGLKAFAAKTASLVEQHLEQAKQIQASIKAQTSASR
jgi:putative membrane protein